MPFRVREVETPLTRSRRAQRAESKRQRLAADAGTAFAQMLC
jgi:hypothetical protein